jgi:hypothetical protein
MTIAEIHGKLSADQPQACNDRMEDLLTSDVFGTMRYAGWDRGFLDWLRGAEPVTALSGIGSPLNADLPEAGIQNMHFAFWPRLPNGREPDVAILITYSDLRAVLMLIEAKYLSGTSDSEPSEGVDSERRTGNQVADQILGLRALTPAILSTWFGLEHAPPLTDRLHLLVTKDGRLPLSVYMAAARYLPRPWPAAAYWVSWTSLPPHLKPHQADPDPGRAALVRDLLLLLDRKELVPFQAFDGRGGFVA